MSIAWPRRPPGDRLHRAPTRRLALAVLVGALIGAFPPAASAAGRVELSTRYPAVVVAPGAEVTFDVDVRTDTPDRVDLSLEQVPAGWDASLRGEGFVIDGVRTDGGEPVAIELEVTVPESAAAGTERIVLAARSGEARTSLELDVRVEAGAAGQVTLTTDHPELRGASDDTFRFSLRLDNDTADELTFALQAQGPERWRVEAKPSGQAQAASAVVDAGGNATIEVTAEVPAGAEAGRYPILVQASSTAHTVEAQLSVEVIGSYELTVTTPDERLNARGSAGSAIEQSIELRNTGTALLEAVRLSHTAPSGWTVTFEPETIDVPAGDRATVMARITPSGEAIAGDYVVTVRASNELADGDVQLRVSVETSVIWGAIGIGLIVAVVIGLGWVFRRYGRR